MTEENAEKLLKESPKKYLIKALFSFLLLVVGVFSFFLVWEPTFSYITVRVFLIVGYCTIIWSGLFAVYIFDKTIRYLKSKKDIFAFIVLGVSSIVIIGITSILINLFGL